MSTTSLEVLSWGIGGSVVDCGRPGMAWLGVPRGGAVDLDALTRANRLVGNARHCAGIETSGGLSVRLVRAAVVVVTGAVAVADVVGGPPVGWGMPVALPAGATLRITRLERGCRAYLGIRGGLVPLDGNRLAIGDEPAAPMSSMAAAPSSMPDAVRLWRGPRLEAVVASAWDRLLTAPLRVTATSRVGCRLAGVALGHRDDAVLESEGIVEGAVQVPPDGSPIVMLADHPTTGGYPVVAVVDPRDLWAVAQAAVGSTLRFADAEQRRR